MGDEVAVFTCGQDGIDRLSHIREVLESRVDSGRHVVARCAIASISME